MLQIIVRVAPGGNQRQAFEVANARLANISNLADTSDYGVEVVEGPNRVAGTSEWSARGHILHHDRRATVWSLVRKVAEFAEREAEKQR
jgi:hypothetical protein